MLNILKIDTNYDSFKPHITDETGALVPYPMGAVFGATDKIKLLFVGDNVPTETASVVFKSRYKGIEIARAEFTYDVAENAYLGRIWWGGEVARGVLAGDESVLTACAFVVDEDGVITEWQFPLNLFASASGLETDIQASKKWSDVASEQAERASESAERASKSSLQAEESAGRASAYKADALIAQAKAEEAQSKAETAKTDAEKARDKALEVQENVQSIGQAQVSAITQAGNKQKTAIVSTGGLWNDNVEKTGNAQKVAVEQAGTNALAEITTKVGDASEFAYQAFEYAHQAGGSADSADTYAQQASEYAFSALEHLAEFCNCKGGYAKLESNNSFTGFNHFCADSVFVGTNPVLTTNSKIPRIGQTKYSLVEATEGSINLWISNNPETTCGVGMSIFSQDGIKMVSASPIGIKSARCMTMCSLCANIQMNAKKEIRMSNGYAFVHLASTCLNLGSTKKASVAGSYLTLGRYGFNAQSGIGITLCSDGEILVSSMMCRVIIQGGEATIKNSDSNYLRFSSCMNIGEISRSSTGKIEMMSSGGIRLNSGRIEMISNYDCTTNLELHHMQIAFYRCGMATFLSRDDEGYLVIDGHRIVTEA